jgi:hypothetical protein
VGGTDLTQASSQGKKVGGTDLKWWVAPIAQTLKPPAGAKRWVAPISNGGWHRLRKPSSLQPGQKGGWHRSQMVGGTDLKWWVAPIAQTLAPIAQTLKPPAGAKRWVAPIAIAIHRLRLRTNAQNANLENAISESKGR